MPCGPTSDGLSLATPSCAGGRAFQPLATKQIAHPGPPWLGWWFLAAAQRARRSTQARHGLGGGFLRRRSGHGGLPLSGPSGALAGTPVPRMGLSAARSDAAHLLDGLVEQKRDVCHGFSLGTTSDPVVGRTKQGESAGSANIKGMKRRWSPVYGARGAFVLGLQALVIFRDAWLPLRPG